MSKLSIAVFLILVFSCLTTGCQQYYYQEGKTIEECRQDRLDCFNELKKYSDLRTFGDYEFKFMEECMMEKGYSLVKEGDLPLRVKREHPQSSLHWRLRGVAGLVEE